MAAEATRTPIEGADHLDMLSAIWILSCNDDNPIITYRGITTRLGLPETTDIKSLVRSRSELFRPGILNSRLDAWKKQLKSGKGRPAWIAEIKDKAEQEEAIDKITRDDVFRNQFRIEVDAPKCDLKIIDWGLSHIERLRKSTADEREAKSKRWGTVIIPIVSLLLAMFSVIGTVTIQWKSLSEQKELKQYEVSFKPKQEAYSAFMTALTNAALAAQSGDYERTRSEVARMDTSLYLFEPFLSSSDRSKALEEMNKVLDICNERLSMSVAERSQEKSSHAFDVSVAQSRSYFRTKLYSALFGNN